MTPRVVVSRSLLESLAFAHPGAEIALTADAAYLSLDGVEYVAVLPRAVAG